MDFVIQLVHQLRASSMILSSVGFVTADSYEDALRLLGLKQLFFFRKDFLILEENKKVDSDKAVTERGCEFIRLLPVPSKEKFLVEIRARRHPQFYLPVIRNGRELRDLIKL